MRLNKTLMYILSVALCVAALIALPQVAEAAPGTPATYVIINGVTLNAANLEYPGFPKIATARLDLSNANDPKLVLNGLNVVSSDYNAMEIDGDITIDLNGTVNTISAAGYTGSYPTGGIRCKGNLTIIDNRPNEISRGSLKVVGGTSSSYESYGIDLSYVESSEEYGAKLTVSSGTLECIGGNSTVAAAGIYAGEMVIDGGSVTAKVLNNNNCLVQAGVCILKSSSLTINNGSLTAESMEATEGSGIITTERATLTINLTGDNASLTAQGKKFGINLNKGSIVVNMTKGTLQAIGGVDGITDFDSAYIALRDGISKFLARGKSNGLPDNTPTFNFGNTRQWYKYKMNTNSNSDSGSYSKNTFTFASNKYLEIVPNDRLNSITLDNTNTYKVGHTITATLDPAAAGNHVTYLWFRQKGIETLNITSINGASYPLTQNDIGCEIYVIASADEPEYFGDVKSSNSPIITEPTSAVTLDPNGGTAGNPPSVIATYGEAMPSIIGTTEQTLPTCVGYTFNGYFDARTGGTQYYTNTGASAKSWDKTDASVTLYAQWTAKISYVDLDPNGGTTVNPYYVEATYGSPMPSIIGGAGQGLPTRTDYTFTGYYDAQTDGTQYYDKDGASVRTWEKALDFFILYAQWNPVTYTVTLDPNGGVTGNPSSVDAVYNEPLPSIVNGSGYTLPTRARHSFNGYASGLGVRYYDENGACVKNWDMRAGDTLYASWTPKTYTVALNLNGGNEAGSPASVTATYGEAMPSIIGATGQKLPARAGYTFAGYYDAPTGGNKYYNADGSSAASWNKDEADPMLYAQWTVNTYSVTLDRNGGVAGNPASVSATYGEAMPSIIGGSGQALPTRTGYTFTGYFDAQTGGKQYYLKSGASVPGLTWDKAANTTLYAQWTAVTGFVILETNGGSENRPSSVTATYGEAMPSIIGAPKQFLPTRTGYTFEGYFDAETGGTQYYNASGAGVKSWDKTDIECSLYARWSPKICTVYLNSNGGNTTGSPAYVTATYGEAMPPIIGAAGQALPTKAGYTFMGYSDTATGGSIYYNADGSSAASWDKDEASSTLYAKWTETVYTITLSAAPANGGSVSGEGAFAPGSHTVTATAGTNYSFARWMENNAQVSTDASYTFTLTANRTLTAQFNYLPPAGINAISGIIVNQGFSKGDIITFTANGAGMDNLNPIMGDARWNPGSWSVNPSGDFSTGMSQSFSTAKMTLGRHTLTVTFLPERFNGTAWVRDNTMSADTKSVSFTLREPPPKTGDSLPLGLLLCLCAVCGLGAVMFARRLRRG